MRNAETFLTQAEQDSLVECVKKAESSTSGEIVPVIATMSYEYPRAGLIGSLIFGALAAVALTLALGREDMWVFLALFLALFFCFSRLFDAIPVLKRPFISKREMHEEVAEAAFTAFHAHGLHNTRDKTGIILYVSVFERSVQVLADKGINDLVNPLAWEEVVTMVTSGIRAGKPGEALCKGVTRCGEMLTERFPIKSDDTDELPNLIIEKAD
ncbi:TPM domain-containing protein [uncultured Pseudodesulfovibrio sp.]|uniref:TPM domain-containing protein n=1 Tax=uncultured Pseudodesulfovibrio sp. TaxID=2035858 RepID=UPI0029C940F6|nr:TPM domain-containing protein [uncultured Pseudodesulfovibrio sp.]